MFSRRPGWIIAAGIVVPLALLLGLLQLVLYKRHEQQSPENVAARYMTDIGRNARDWSARLATDPEQIASVWMTQDGNPSELYAKALAVYYERPATFDAYTPGQTDTLPSAYLQQIDRAMELLIAASKLRGGAVFPDRYKTLIGYDVASDTVGCDLSELRAIRRLGEVASNRAWYFNNRSARPDRTTRAWELYQARFTLGLKLYAERICFREMLAGLQFMSIAPEMGAFVQDPAQKALLAGFDEDRLKFTHSTIARIWGNAMCTLDPNVYDMIALANDCPEPMWRVEAILTLGRAKYRCDPARNQAMLEQSKQQAALAIKQFLGSDDPHIREAAEKADRLLIEDFRRMTFANPYEF